MGTVRLATYLSDLLLRSNISSSSFRILPQHPHYRARFKREIIPIQKLRLIHEPQKPLYLI